MKIVLCLDTQNGMLFNHRRQSQDAGMRRHLLKTVGDHRLLMNAYSAKIFKNDSIIVDEDFLSVAGDDDFCFVENIALDTSNPNIDTLIVYRWNRLYPSDTVLDIDTAWEIHESFDIKGTSHDPITVQILKRNKKA